MSSTQWGQLEWGQLARLSLTLMITAWPHMAVARDSASPYACHLQRGAQRSVVQVLDAQTLLLDDGSKVLLVGAMAPFKPMPSQQQQHKAGWPRTNTQWPLLRDSKAALAKLVLGRSIELAYGGERKDRYGRRLAQVYLLPASPNGKPPTAERDISQSFYGKRGLWLQAWLVGTGLARAYALPGNTSCLASLALFERRAIAAHSGLWAHAAYQIRAAHLTGALLRYRATYQVIEGRVLKIGRSRSRSYLNFGSNWRRDFTVGIDKSVLRKFAAAGLNLGELPGRRVRIRGWIEVRNGPFILATDPGQIELINNTQTDGGH